MLHRAVGGRIAVDVPELALPFPENVVVEKLLALGFERLEVDLIELARLCIEHSTYRRGARPQEAPETVDCSSLVKWLFGEYGVWLPRRTIQQRELGHEVSECFAAGDVVFCSGRQNWFYEHEHPASGTGHVGIYLGNRRVIHAASTKRGVVEDSLEDFLGTEPGAFRGARRYIRPETRIFKIPKHIDVETSDDLRWIILSRCASS
ncbi:MAG: NlpC/P60 family protein [Patescibacteria group bacterium]|jgi:hypothetical protein